ncbi:MAG: DUF3427 domain-containing protein, partial [Oligoflexia bacterium]|nr:DUF3427 domain-containing protein [Oligoflexia bacterium]
MEVSRKKGLHRNLLVSATGTGKTVMAAVDYARLAVKLKRARLLFVAHREEILEQSLVLFRQAMKDPAFGELWVGANRPSRFEHVFASIQSLKSTGLGELNPDHFDVVIVDEFHHAAAPSYQSLLTRLRPVELLGLTATPERSDGLPILDHFDHRIAAELRLWDAIDQHYLVPFDYYGINDGLDLRSIPWRRGRGYDVEALTHVLTSNDVWARTVVQQTIRRADPETMSALAFCVSVDHARYMARVFREAGLAAEAIWADTPETERKASLKRLAKGETKIIFSVDLFNEGVDVPAVDTLLLLRPTDSPVLFLQQLGRGLRRRPGKERCLVLDFVGQHRQEFRFDRRLRALLGGSLSQLRLQIERGFPFLPAGCNMELDAVAKERILENLKNSIPTRWNEKVAELKTLVKTRGRVTLREFLKETELELSDLYQGNRGWSDLLEAAQVECSPSGPHEKELRRACGRLLHIDDPERIRAYRDFLTQTNAPKCSSMSERDRRLFRMLVASVTERAIEGSTSLDEAASLLWAHSQVVRELLELLDGLEEKISHVVSPLQRMPDVPLHVHARYTRIEILAAFGCGERARVMRWQTGVHWSKEAKADLFAFTLDKTSGLFSPTTRYRDYAISPELIHWESQSVTRADSETGLRYQNHQKMGTSVMLFARPDTNDRAFWFLGPGNYQKHVSERPMAITWKLDRQLP